MDALGSRPDALRDSKRFRILGCLGEGGMGVVYEAFDAEQNARVALKMLRALSPEHVIRLKREFRALQDLRHPNLVSLGELIEDNGELFLTMELVTGSNFHDYVRTRSRWVIDSQLPAIGQVLDGLKGSDHDTMKVPVHVTRPRRRESSSGSGERVRVVSAGSATPDQPETLAAPLPVAEPLVCGFDEERLRSALAQLSSALIALHQAGKVHRDIKPSNVLVTVAGRVVILDLGLVTEIQAQTGVTERNVVGTAAYMAPEQAASKPVGPEADWYSVGVMLYEALVGELPHDGPALKMLIDKQRDEPVPPSKRVPGVPPDLESLCMELLSFEPASRPSGPAILQRIGARNDASLPLRSSSSHAGGPPFVGRTKELKLLHEAFDDTRSGEPVAAYVYGESGMGKSVMARRFLNELTTRSPDTVVLFGRCYEREAVPFKAVDGILESLSGYMQRLSSTEAAALVPRKAGLLPLAFPVLRRVEVLAEAPHVAIADPQEMRARVFAALRELFSLLCERHPVVLSIDDFQWTDSDSVALLSELLRPPEAPPLLLIVTWRTAVESPKSTRFPIPNLPGEVRHVHLGPLHDGEARDLARKLARSAGGGELSGDTWDSIVQEAGGHPLFIDELVRHVVLGGGVPMLRMEEPARVRLDEALWTRISNLDEPVRKALEAVAIAGFPISQEVAANAVEIPVAEFSRHASYLRVANLVITTGPRRADTIEPFHDRVREAIVSNLSADARQAWHKRYSRALLTMPGADPEALAVHLQGAGDLENAAKYATKAADRAAEALAFDRAAQLYRTALELGAPSSADRRSLLGRLGDALSNSGRGTEAAEAYLQGIEGASRADGLDLRRKAAEQLLRSGRIDQGMDLLRQVLEGIGEPYPKTPAQAMASLLLRRAEIRIRGLGFREREVSQISSADLTRIDVCCSIAALVGVVDTISGALFQTRSLLLALRAGEPTRIARALAAEMGYSCVGGSKTAKRTAELTRMGTNLAARTGNVNAMATVRMADALACYLLGRFREGLVKAEEAEAMFRAHCTGVFWELSTTVFIATGSLAYLGEVKELSARVFRAWREAQERGDLYAALNVASGFQNIAWLALDSPEEARRVTDTAIHQWSQSGVHLQHYNDMFAQANIDLYEGNARRAHQRVVDAWPIAERAHLLEFQQNRVEMHDLLGRSAMCIAGSSRLERKRFLRTLEESIQQVRSEEMFWSNPMADRLEAGLALLHSERQRALSLFQKAEEGFARAEMGLFAAAAKRQRGKLLGGKAGTDIVQEADAWMKGQGIRNPEAMCFMLCPDPNSAPPPSSSRSVPRSQANPLSRPTTKPPK
ncbi:MAG: AAA family ATPase [Deltaproteobacteria bacterium]|nr:AAA family ATPase [Deltaproteobacteria bacterium]